MDSIGSLIAWLGRVFILFGLVAIPWCMGGRNLDGILLVSSAVVIAMMCALVSMVMQKSKAKIPLIVFPVIIALVYCSLQTQPGIFPERKIAFGKPAEFWHEVMKLPKEETSEVRPISLITSSISVSPYETLTETSMGVIALCAGVVCCILFSKWHEQMLLFWVIGLNGLGMSVFGLYQNSTWNNKIFWEYAFPANAHPFGAFVNRNNAAGYLNLTLACMAGISVYYLLKNCPLGLSLIRTEATQSKLDLKNREIAAYILSGIELPFIVGVIALAGIMAGVFVAQSRSGVLSVGLGLLMAAFLVGQRLRVGKMVLMGTLSVVILITATIISALLLWLTSDIEVFRRLKETNLEVIGQDARWNNWGDAVKTLEDHWLWGTGLRSYQFAHKPYQSFEHDYWFYYAENQYLQLAIETGVVGMLCLGFLFLIWYSGIKQLMNSPARISRECLTLLVISIIVLVSQGLQAVVDFGLYHQASLMTAIVLMCVTLTTPVIKDDLYENLIPQEKKLSFWEKFVPLVLTVVLCVTAIPALLQIHNVAKSTRNLGSYVAKLKSYQITEQRNKERRQILSLTEDLTSLNPAYHLNRVSALIEEYVSRRVEHVREKKEITREAMSAEITQQSSLFLLRKIIVDAQARQSFEKIAMVKEDSDVKELLLPALKHLHKAIELNPLDWRPHIWLMLLEPLEGGTAEARITHARDTLQLNPSDPEVGYYVGLAAFQDGGDRLSMQAFRLCLTFDSKYLNSILEIVLTRHTFEQVLEKIIPPDPKLYLGICKASDVAGITAKERRHAGVKAIKQLENVNKDQRSTDETLLLSEGYFLIGQYDSAIKTLSELLTEVPLSVEGRVLLADIYLKIGNNDKAFEVVLAGLKISPAQKLKEKLIKIEELIKPNNKKSSGR